MSIIRVPVFGTAGKAVRLERGATEGAIIGQNLKFADGSVPTVAELAAALSTGVDPTATAVAASSGVAKQTCVHLTGVATTYGLTNQANALQFFRNSSAYAAQLLMDLTGYTQVRMTARVATASASANTPVIILAYATTASTSTGSYSDIGTSQVVLSLASTGQRLDTGWIGLAAGAIADDRYIALMQAGGDGSATPIVGDVQAFFR